jgi:phosphonate transport system substrate-binding protein
MESGRRRLGVFGMVVAALVAAGGALPRPSEAGGTIRIGTSEKAGKSSARNFAPLIRYLNSIGQKGWKYEVETWPTPEALFADFRDRKVDVAFLGPVLYVKAHSAMGAVPLVADGPKYTSVVFVRNDSPIKKIEDIRGKSFAFGYKDSTSSHLFPLLLLSRARIKEEDLGPHEFVGNHELVVDAVLAGRFDAGGVISGAFESNKAKGLRQIVVSDPIPGVPLVVRRDADLTWVNELRTALLAYKPSGTDTNEPFARGAVAVNDADYNQIRFLCKVVLGEEYH